MVHTWSFNAQFAIEFSRFPQDQQDAVLDFTDAFEQHGLSDFSKFPGKITYSWKGVPPGSAEFIYAKANELWHYHIGLPTYTQGPKYSTSDWVLHFQWPKQGDHINLVDLCYHYTSGGLFYVPAAKYLAPNSPD
ncbi:hypothetical protein [Paraburkholderia mimosarum]|uniref:hypothetical protein n=1 Tax=Paraburkholderia mimosarum TaxID=312026 RepID=UPI0004846D5F|nr:hypothetical protein [Paraburkholderia mimosarum]